MNDEFVTIELFSSCNQGEIEEYKDAGINE